MSNRLNSFPDVHRLNNPIRIVSPMLTMDRGIVAAIAVLPYRCADCDLRCFKFRLVVGAKHAWQEAFHTLPLADDEWASKLSSFGKTKAIAQIGGSQVCVRSVSSRSNRRERFLITMGDGSHFGAKLPSCMAE